MMPNRAALPARIFPGLPLLALLTAMLLPSTLRAEFDEDVRFWQTVSLNLHEDADWRFTFAAETRLFDEGDFLGAWLLFPTVQYKAHPNLDLGATYLLEDIRADCDRPYDRLHIFWLHASPHWQLNDHLKFSMRHVLGLRSVESQQDYWMSRHCFALDYKLRDCGRLVSIGTSTELFYRYDEDRLFENRLIPLKCSFKISEQTTLSLYLMAQSRYFGNCDEWQTAYVFGQALAYKW